MTEISGAFSMMTGMPVSLAPDDSLVQSEMAIIAEAEAEAAVTE